MNAIGLSEYHENNLRVLARYLRGEIRACFAMERFAEDDTNTTDCGSVGCAVGHGPYAGVAKSVGERWPEYSVRVFGLLLRHSEWCWCFDNLWVTIDNTPEGAASRIEWLLDGHPIASWRQAPDIYRGYRSPDSSTYGEISVEIVRRPQASRLLQQEAL